MEDDLPGPGLGLVDRMTPEHVDKLLHGVCSNPLAGGELMATL